MSEIITNSQVVWNEQLLLRHRKPMNMFISQKSLPSCNPSSTLVAGLPEGEVKENNLSRKNKTEYRLFTLEEQSDKYCTLALLEKEMQISMIEKQLAEVVVFTQLVEAHKASLS
jgi:hypothetical protein